MDAEEITINRIRYDRLIVDFKYLEKQVKELKESDIKIKRSMFDYFYMIVSWIHLARAHQNIVALDLCLIHIRDSLLSTIKDLEKP